MSTRNVIVTSVLTSLLTSICTFFALHYMTSRKTTLKEVMVPQVVGLKPSQAMEVLDGRKLRMQIIERRPDPTVPAGHICSQHPYADSKVLSHSAVNVVLSSGPPRITVPPCTAAALQEYSATLSAQKLKLGAVTYAPHDTLAAGQIIDCEPKSGSVVESGATVALTVAKKADPTKEIPKLKGMSCTKAKKVIEEQGFKVGKVNWRSYDAPPFLVMGQSPEPGTKAPPGTEIEINCSKDD
ncbi:MAG: PASTA domain-containing protein [Polyangia bacterium]|jgi:serine/threonine-protein kinase|nr:PASTA domain-containing protein [Polyangia bacterium]